MSPPSSPPPRVDSPSPPRLPALTIRYPSNITTATTSTTGTTATTATGTTTATGAKTSTPPSSTSTPYTTAGYSPNSIGNSSYTHTSVSGTSTGTGAVLSPTTSASTRASPTHHAPSPWSPAVPPGAGLLVPTDRALDDLEDNWLPRLGKLRVEREVRVPGYSLYGIRSWYLSRHRWAFTIAASTGKPTDTISCYVIVPSPELSPAAAATELAEATQRLAREVNGLVRKTEFGILLVSSPAGYGQELSPIATGDMREAWPFIVLNTALRRLGCGGRAAMGNEFPVPAVRRKFYELYRITQPKGGDIEPTNGAPVSPPASPTTLQHGTVAASALFNQPAAETVANSPILLNVVELVKLLQGALTLWGMYGAENDEHEIDGLFCDETKAGLFEWRRVMGMESDDGFKLAKETSGGCIDPRTLAALLSSITSVRYQLAVLGVEKVPKDPFSSPKKFLNVWRAQQAALGCKSSQYLSVSGIRALNACYISGRSRTHASDALKVHRFLLSGVASATSNLRGSNTDDASTPLRKREQHNRFRGEDDESGIGMIVPEGNGNTVAAPDVITTDLEAYRKLIEKSREKEWDLMGARRVAELWSGVTAERGPDRDGGRHHGRLQAFRRRVTQNNDTDDDVSAAPSAIGAFKGMRDRTGAALKGGFGLVGRRHPTAAYDTSDSEGPSKGRRKQTVPLVIEPEGDDNRDTQGTLSTRISRSPSPSVALRDMPLPLTPPTLRAGHHANYPAIQSPLQQSVRLSSSNISGDVSDVSGDAARSNTTSPVDVRRSLGLSGSSVNGRTARTPALPSRVAPHMLRTRSGPADTALDNVTASAPPTAQGHGLGLYPNEKIGRLPFDAARKLKRNKSFSHPSEYRGVRRKPPQHLAVDVAMCQVVWDLRKRERELAKRAADMQTLERSALAAWQAIFDAREQRLNRVLALEKEAARLVDELEIAGATAVEDDQNLHHAANNIQFFLTEDMNTNELVWGLHDLQKAWEGFREEPAGVDVPAKTKRGWWPF